MSERHAKAKQLFLNAIELPPAERLEYLKQQCGGNSSLEREVATLLEHHDTVTIIQPLLSTGQHVARPNTMTGDQRPAASVMSDAESERWHSFSQGLPQLDDETCTLLRRRLWAVTLVLSLGLLYVFLRSLLSAHESIFTLRTLCLVGMAVCCGVLSSRKELSLVQLRMIELAAAANVVLTYGLMSRQLLMQSAAEGDVLTTISLNHWQYHVWSVTILIYGIFMPNTWRRAALLLLPAACLPYVTTYLVCRGHSQIAAAVAHDRIGLPIPLPFVSALTAIFAANLIHTVRRDSFRAKRFAQYRLTRLLGVGGSGEVYEAEHLLLKRPCAIKLIRPELDDDPAALARFEREVRATARLTHWNTIEVYDFGQTADGLFYYVMELLPGRDLGELVRRWGPLPAPRAVHFLRQVCGALQEAHELGLVHRDIKPGNIFAARRGGMWDVAKLLDFGLVRETRVERSAPLSGTAIIAGTPHFMAPEQAASYRTADSRSDIYSLGAVAYYLLTGRAPLEGESPLSILLAQVDNVVTPPREIRGDLPADLEAVVLRCLAKKPDDRFQTAAELRAALAACRCGEWSQTDAAEWWRQHAPIPNDSTET